MIDRPGITVIGIERGLKYHATVKDWGYRLNTMVHIPVPQLKLPPAVVVPVLVQVNEEIKASLEIQSAVMNEINVD